MKEVIQKENGKIVSYGIYMDAYDPVMEEILEIAQAYHGAMLTRDRTEETINRILNVIKSMKNHD